MKRSVKIFRWRAYWKAFVKKEWECDRRRSKILEERLIHSNKKETSDFHGTVSFDPIKMSQQNINQNVYQTSDIQENVII